MSNIIVSAAQRKGFYIKAGNNSKARVDSVIASFDSGDYKNGFDEIDRSYGNIKSIVFKLIELTGDLHDYALQTRPDVLLQQEYDFLSGVEKRISDAHTGVDSTDYSMLEEVVGQLGEFTSYIRALVNQLRPLNGELSNMRLTL